MKIERLFWVFDHCPAHAQRRNEPPYWIADVSPPYKKKKLRPAGKLRGTRTFTFERIRKNLGCGLTSAIQNGFWLRKKIFCGTSSRLFLNKKREPRFRVTPVFVIRLLTRTTGFRCCPIRLCRDSSVRPPSFAS